MQTLHVLEQIDAFSSLDNAEAETARELIEANRWYQISNNSSAESPHRLHARQQAKALLHQILNRDADHADAYNLAGRIALDEAEIATARELIDRAIAIDDSKPLFWLNRGYVAIMQRQYDQAEAHLNQALQRDRSSAQAFTAIALTYYLREDFLGAFLRYRSLLTKGLLNESAKVTMIECCAQLQADRYDESLEQDLLVLFQLPDIDHRKLGRLGFSLIRYKYDLDNPEAQLDLDALAEDPLLIHALAKANLSDPKVEELVTLLRQSLLVEVIQTGILREELQELGIAIGLLAERTDYVFDTSEDETLLVEQIDDCIRAMVQGTWNVDDLAGALIIVSMYKALYTQNYSYQLLAHDLTDWPKAMQSVLAKNLYEKSDLHAIRFNLPQDDNALARPFNAPISTSAYPKWEQLPYHSTTSLYEALVSELGKNSVPTDMAHKPLNILITDCATGERALSFARYFDNVTVTAVDTSADNIAYAMLKARQYNIQNVHFKVVKSAADLRFGSTRFDLVELGHHSSQNIEFVLKVKALCQPLGLIRLHFNSVPEEIAAFAMQTDSFKLLPTDENVRKLRSQFRAHAIDTDQEFLLHDQTFYSLPGCKTLFLDASQSNQCNPRTLLEKTGLIVVQHLQPSQSVDSPLQYDEAIYVYPRVAQQSDSQSQSRAK